MEDDSPFAKAQTVDPEVRAYVYSLVNAVSSERRRDPSNANERHSLVAQVQMKMVTISSATML